MDVIKAHDREFSQYDRQAKVWGWNPDVFFGLMWEYVQPGDCLLDAGIGTGLCSIPFYKARVKISGIDGSDKMLGLCRGRKIATRLERHDIEDFPWPFDDHSFDHVISGGVFHFFGSLKPIFQEVKRNLVEKGVFGFNTSLLVKSDLDQAGLPADSAFASVLDESSGVKIYKHSEAYISTVLGQLGMSVEKKLTFLASRNPKTRQDHYSTLFICR